MKTISIFLDSNVISKDELLYQNKLMIYLSGYTKQKLVKIYICKTVKEELDKHAYNDYRKKFYDFLKQLRYFKKVGGILKGDAEMKQPSVFAGVYDKEMKEFLSESLIDVLNYDSFVLEEVIKDAVYREELFVNSPNAPGILDYMLMKNYERFIFERDLDEYFVISNDKKIKKYCKDNNINLFSSLQEFVDSSNFEKYRIEYERNVYELRKMGVSPERISKDIIVELLENDYVEDIWEYLNNDFDQVIMSKIYGDIEIISAYNYDIVIDINDNVLRFCTVNITCKVEQNSQITGTLYMIEEIQLKGIMSEHVTTDGMDLEFEITSHSIESSKLDK